MESMTGFGAGSVAIEGAAGPITLSVEIRSVNHRHIDVRINSDDELQALTGGVEALIRKRGTRGRFDVRMVADGRLSPPPKLDAHRARSAYAELCALRDELAPGDSVPLSLLSSVPGLFEVPAPQDCEALQGALHRAANAAFDELESMRSVEGEALAKDIVLHLDAVTRNCGQLQADIPRLVASSRERLRGRLQALLDERFSNVDEVRLEQEVAILADKSDVAEELARLASHVTQFRKISAGAGLLGRKLDFLLQEMGREANTIGSKIHDASITIRIVELKSCLERVREQVQNVA
ncbi:MAG: YicC/YloC family endoribonuclease [Polyangiales bacterium]